MRLSGASGRSEQPDPDRDDVLTVPNLVTVLRFCGVPVFVWLVLSARDYGAAVVVLAVMGSTDWVDGYLARRFNQASRLGRIMDPIADRLALIVVFITLAVAGIAPAWLLYVVFVPDAVLVATSLWLFHSHPDLPVLWIGKIRTALFLVGTPLLLLSAVASPAGPVLRALALGILIAGCALHLAAAVVYFRAILAKHRSLGRRGAGTGDA